MKSTLEEDTAGRTPKTGRKIPPPPKKKELKLDLNKNVGL